MKQRMQGNFDTKQKAISAATAQLTPFNIEYISSLLPQLWSSPRDFLWEQGGGLLCDRIYISASPSLGQHKTSTMQTEQLDLLESSQGPKEVQQRGPDLSKRSLLETHSATQCTIWGRDATCDIEIACTLQHFVV